MMKRALFIVLTVFFTFAATASADSGSFTIGPSGTYDLRAGIQCFSTTSSCDVTIKLYSTNFLGQPSSLIHQTTRSVTGFYTELTIPVGYLSAGSYIAVFTYSNYNCTMDHVHLMPVAYH
ncbi:hypothetical protein [Paenibacillus paeoniae]|uniref:Secreted protein n=1 Tax=Paenibacillus paeoniae TaxID=2292705 RepID=A0A371PL06_9BACL|nr:hypothetical protein [Paenibacillus paeoniae]REK76783.1 hypothetical protein DX130_07040 [Paenibacillus paeoniae]